MASNFAQIAVVISADTKGLEQGLSRSTGALKKFSTDFNSAFIEGMTKGTVSTKEFGGQLLKAADQAGLGTSEIRKMATATGLFTDKQILAGTASANMAAKAKSLSEAVAKGEMTTREAGKAFGDYANEQAKLADASKSTGQKISEMGASMLKTAAVVAGVAVAVAAAGKQIYELGARGAIVQQTADSFDYLSQKLGLAPDLLDQLRDASRGTIPDMQLMSSTATLLAGTSDELGRALGDATPQLMEIAKAANKLNPSLGTTAHMYESIAMGIKRASPMILDNLGLTIKIGDANEAMAKSLGKSVEQLTAEEKQMALLNATLEAGDKLIAQVGGNTDSATDAFGQLEATIANISDTFAARMSPAISQVVSGINDLITAMFSAVEVQVLLQKATEDGVISQGEYNMMIAKGGALWTDHKSVLEDVTLKMLEHEEATRAEQAALELLNSGVEEAKGKWAEYTGAIETSSAATVDYKKKLQELTLFVQGPVGNEMDKFTEKQGELAAKMEEVRLKIEELESQDLFTEEQYTQLQDAQIEYAGLKMKYDEFIAAHGEGSKKWATEEEEIRAAMDLTLIKIGELQQVEHLTPEQQTELDNLKLEYENLSREYEENATAHDEATKRILYNMLQQRISLILTGDATEKEKERAVKALEEWAIAYGILDERTRDYYNVANDLADSATKNTSENLGKQRLEWSLYMGVLEQSEKATLNNRDALMEIEDEQGPFASAMGSMRGELSKTDSSLDTSASKADNLARKIDAIKGKTITITTRFVTQGQPYGSKQYRQHGGPVMGGGSYIVGEAGPELFVPSASGTIIPNNALNIGTSMMAGVSSGLYVGARGALRDTMNVMDLMVRGAEKALGIHSPSEMFYDIGVEMMRGLEAGIKAGTPRVNDALDDVSYDISKWSDHVGKDISNFTIDTTDTWEGMWIDLVNSQDKNFQEIIYDGKTRLDAITSNVKEFASTNESIWNWHMSTVKDIQDKNFQEIIYDGKTRLDVITSNTKEFASTNESIWNWHMSTMNAINETGMKSIESNTRSAIDSITSVVREGGARNEAAMRESYNNMLRYWQNAQSIFGAPTPNQGFLPDWVPDKTRLESPPPSQTRLESPPLNYTSAPAPSSSGTKSLSVTNNLIINTNAPVTSDVPDLLLLRAWASG